MEGFAVQHLCPSCHHMNEACASLEGKRGPEDGDVALCVYCGRWMVLDHHEPTGARKPNPAEVEELMQDPLALEASMAWVHWVMSR